MAQSGVDALACDCTQRVLCARDEGDWMQKRVGIIRTMKSMMDKGVS